MTTTLKFNIQQTQRAVAKLREKAPYAIARAINRAAVSGRTQLARDTSADMKLKVGVVRDKIVIEEATTTKHLAKVYASNKRVALIEFGARGRYPSRGKGKGVSARTQTGRYPNAFIAFMRSGHKGVFARKTTARLPIHELFGPSIAHVASKHAPAAADRMKQQCLKNLVSEFRFYISRSSAA